MIEIRAVVLPAGVVQQGEKTDHGQVGTTRLGDVQSECVNPLPVAWSVDGMRSAPGNGHHVFTDPKQAKPLEGFSHSPVF